MAAAAAFACLLRDFDCYKFRLISNICFNLIYIQFGNGYVSLGEMKRLLKGGGTMWRRTIPVFSYLNSA